MAGFALLYNQTDITSMMAQAQATVDRMPPGDRSLFNAVWSGGLSNWGAAPDAPEEFQGSVDRVKLIHINAKQGNKQITMEEFCKLLERMAAANPSIIDPNTLVETSPGATFLISVADDIRHSGGIEPWPPA